MKECQILFSYLASLVLVFNLIAFCVSLIFAFSKTFWSQSVIAEVYTLTAFFIILLLYILLKGNFYFFMFFLGFGIAHHHMILFLLPLTLVFILQREKIKFRRLINGLLLLFLGLFIYFYLPIRSIANPLIDWGNPENIKNFIRHVTRTQYSFKTYHGYSISLFFQQAKSYFHAALSQFGILTFLLFILSFVGLFRIFKIKKFFFITIFIFLAMSFGFIIMINFYMTAKNLYVVETFYIPSYMMISIWVFSGLLYIFEKFKNTKLTQSFGLIILLPLSVIFSNFNYNDLSKSYFLKEYGKNILNTLDKNSILFVSGDNPMFSLVYLQKVEKNRLDLKIYDDFGSVFENIYGDDFLFIPKLEHGKIINEIQMDIITKTRNPVYCTLGSNPYKFPKFEKIPYGLVYKLAEKREIVKNFFDEHSFEWIKDRKANEDYLLKELAVRFYFAQAEYYLYTNEKVKSKEYFIKALNFADGIEWLETHLGNVFSKLESKSEALESYLKVVERNPYNADAHNNLGVLYLDTGEIDKAKNEFEKALKINENYAASINNLGTVYLKKGMRNKAYDLYKKAIAIDDNQVDAHSNLGALFTEDGEFDKAIEEYKKALKLNPSDKKALNNLGVIYFLKGINEEALTLLEKAVKLEPNNADAHNNLGSVYAKMNKIDLAVVEWEKALKLNPDHKDAKENLRRVKKQ